MAIRDLTETQKIIHECPIIAVLVVDRTEDAVPLAEALLEGGVGSIELTLRTPSAIDSIERIKQSVPEITLGAGTVIFPDQVRQAIDAGADFGVSPGYCEPVARAAVDEGFPFAPGVAVPSDIEAALQHGFRVLKFNPAEALGGLEYLGSMAGPYGYLNLSFIPLGGVSPTNASAYLRSSLVSAVGGSWIAPRALIRERNWAAVTANARDAMAMAEQAWGERSNP